ncbi:hypothetical protein EJ05DRAFT_479863, partial [Pseudovirgaria hyperparasitica]
MNNIRGTCMYLARSELQSDNYYLLRSTIDDYARFFALAYHNTPKNMERASTDQLYYNYLSQLQRLRGGLPKRFRSTLNNLILCLPDLFAD